MTLALTSEQLAAAESSAADVLVEAAAGSGKTGTLVARARHLVKQGADPDRILAITFTRSAAAEVRARVGHAIRATTFHGFAFEILRDSGELKGLRIANAYESDAAVEGMYGGPLRRVDRDRPTITELRAAIVDREAGERLDSPAQHHVRVALMRLFDVGVVPLWDLLPRLLAAPERISAAVDHVLIDEFQDVSRNEAAVGYRAGSQSLFAVGDPSQAIFSWRGGAWRDIEGAEKHRLAQSFRFGEAIAEAANKIGAEFGAKLIEGNGGDGTVHLMSWDEWGARRFQPWVALAPSRTLVLTRTNFAAESVVRLFGFDVCELARRGKNPFEVEGDRFESIWSRGLAVVSTIHAAKGREADRVLVLADSTEGDSDEEKRVRYVAATRAREELVMVGR